MGRTILVVEDFDDVRDAMRILLELRGYSVVEATDGQRAVELAVEHTPDLILMDLSMPVMDGIEATLAIRANDTTSDIPILAVTSYSQNYRDRATAAGCDEIFTKAEFMGNVGPILERHITGM